jgi:ribonuclease HII
MADPPTFAAERTIWRQGFRLIAGVDEVGRGPLAGPVAAGAVILPVDARLDWLAGVRDSKQLTPVARTKIAPLIQRDAIAAAVAFVSVANVDQLGIAEATRLAMLQAIDGLPSRPDHLLIDAFRIGACALPQTPITGGDAYSLSIACASIIAKVARDGLMEAQDALYPGYGFHRNKGYGTPAHLEALQRLGPCDLHRRSFAPVRDMPLSGRIDGVAPA